MTHEWVVRTIVVPDPRDLTGSSFTTQMVPGPYCAKCGLKMGDQPIAGPEPDDCPGTKHHGPRGDEYTRS